MRVFDAPLVTLVARPSFDEGGVGAVLNEYGEAGSGWRRGQDDSDGESLPELMGRLCYGSFGPRQGRVGAEAYLGHILEAGHGSVLEHACWSFVATRVSRGLTHQMVRHRAGWAWSQESQHFVRYTHEDAGDEDLKSAQEAGVVLTGVPEELRPLFLKSVELSLGHYAEAWLTLRESGMKKKDACERARGLLPNCLESRLGFTANARALRHFCELRGARDNVLEIRLVAAQVADQMKFEAPAIFADVVIRDGDDGHPVVSSAHRKV